MKIVRNYLRMLKEPFPVNSKPLFTNFKKKKKKKKKKLKIKKNHIPFSGVVAVMIISKKLK